MKTVLKITFLLLILFLGYYLIIGKNRTTISAPQYQTGKVEITNLVSSVTSSGTVTTSNAASITTTSSGVVKKVLVKSGDVVKTGQLIAEIDLDLIAKQKYQQASSTYQSAKNSLESAKANLYTQQASSFAANQKFINDAVARGLTTDDPTYIQQNATWLAAEAGYKNQQATISQASTNLSSAYLSYQQSSPYIYAPISGKVTSLVIQPGSVIASSSTSSKIGTVVTSATPNLQVNLTELDVAKVKVGQVATVTFDSLPGKTFTGKVVSIDTQGSVSSNVTTYPTYISMDLPPENLFSNMAVTVSIIVATKDNALTVPSSAIVTQNGQTVVRILGQGNTLTFLPVTTGLISSGKTEILSGLTEGQEVVTSSTTSQTTNSTQTQSVFSGVGGGTFRQLR